MSRRQWEESIALMVRRHNMPPLPAKEQKVVLKYLEATYPPRAPAAGRRLAKSVLAAVNGAHRREAIDFSRKSHRSRRLSRVELSTFFA